MQVIKLVKNTIEIPFVDEDNNVVYTVHFDRTDEKVRALSKMMEELEDLKAEEVEEDYDKAKDFVERVTDQCLGEGTFKVMFDHNPILLAVCNYLLAIGRILQDEILKETEGLLMNKHTK